MNTKPTRTSAVPVALEDPAFNRGVAFTAAEREALGLTRRLPTAILTLEQQANRAYQQLERQGVEEHTMATTERSAVIDADKLVAAVSRDGWEAL